MDVLLPHREAAAAGADGEIGASGAAGEAAGSGAGQLDGVELPERAEGGDLASAVAAVGVDAAHHGDVPAAGQRGADHADVRDLVAAQVRAFYLEGDPLGGSDHGVIERLDGRRTAVPGALRVER